MAYLSIIGLLLDIVGVILLFFYEPPRPETDAILLESAPSEEERERVRRIKAKFSKLALILLVLGFVLQLIPQLYNL